MSDRNWLGLFLVVVVFLVFGGMGIMGYMRSKKWKNQRCCLTHKWTWTDPSSGKTEDKCETTCYDGSQLTAGDCLTYGSQDGYSYVWVEDITSPSLTSVEKTCAGCPANSKIDCS